MKGRLQSTFFLLVLLIGNSNLSSQVIGEMYSLVWKGGTPPNSTGTINMFDPLNNKDTALINLTGGNGNYPYGNLIQNKDGILYGTINYGGTHGSISAGGVIMRYNTANGQDTILYDFHASAQDANTPFGTLLLASDNKMYGLSYYGGCYANTGAIFSFDPVTKTETVLDSLTSATVGYYPTGSFIQGTDGLLYGTTTTSAGGYGTIFRFDINNDSAVLLHNFNGPDGNYPRGSLLQVNDSMLYGLTMHGGAYTGGVLFSYNINSHTETALVSFRGSPDGAYPEGSLIQASDGNLYGTTSVGGVSNQGTLFRFNIIADTEIVIISFNNSTGYSPYGDVIQASDGRLYGNTNSGGAYNAGTIFSYDITSNIEMTLYSYNDTTGQSPYADLLEVMSAAPSTTNNYCSSDNSGAITINPRGGKPPFTYLWNTGSTNSSLSNLPSGIYTYTVTDSTGMSIVYTDTIKPLPIGIIFPASYPCNGENNGTVSASVSGGTAPYSYSWSNGSTIDTLSNIADGTFTCTITDAHGCTFTDSIDITQAGILTITGVTIIPSTFPNYNNGSITVHVTGGIPPEDSTYYLFLWSNGGSSEDSLINADSGIYAVCVTSPYGCGSVCDSNLVITGLQNLRASEAYIKVYPNPSEGLMKLYLYGNGYESLAVDDITGKQVFKQYLNPEDYINNQLLDLRGLADGVYILYVITTESVLTGKIIIQKQ